MAPCERKAVSDRPGLARRSHRRAHDAGLGGCWRACTGRCQPLWAVGRIACGMLSRSRGSLRAIRALTADGTLLTALRAEAVKVFVPFGLLALVLATYKDVCRRSHRVVHRIRS